MKGPRATDVVMMLGAVLVAGCAVLAALGFRGRVNTVGIDLGTTFSVVAVNEHGLKGVRVLRDFDGRLITPSIVAFLGSDDDDTDFSGDGAIVVGRAAIALQRIEPARVIYDAKRFIGRAFDDAVDAPAVASGSDALDDDYDGSGDGGAELRAQAANRGFELAEAPAATNKTLAAEGASGLGFVLRPRRSSSATAPGSASSAGGAKASSSAITVVTPEAVGAAVVRHLMAYTAAALGHSQVNKAVIAVPAAFSPRQRAATGMAFKAAGLKVTRVLEEPVAAALAYGLQRKPHVHHILVYDFGGGTLDVSLLYVSHGSVQVFANSGDNQLGGSDLDSCLRDHLDTLWRTDDTDDSGGVWSAAEAEAACGALETVELDVSRIEFEQACAAPLQRALRPVFRVLEEANIKRDEVDEVVLVGGSSRIPKVREMLRRELGLDRLNLEIDPDVTVAYGCACVVD